MSTTQRLIKSLDGNLYDTPLQNFTSLKMIFKGLLIQNNGNVIAIFINTFLCYYWTEFV